MRDYILHKTVNNNKYTSIPRKDMCGRFTRILAFWRAYYSLRAHTAEYLQLYRELYMHIRYNNITYYYII